jgi:hypothetical protein
MGDQHVKIVISKLAVGLPFHGTRVGSGKGVTHGQSN